MSQIKETDMRDFRVMDSAKGWKVVCYYEKSYYYPNAFVLISNHTSWKTARDYAQRLRDVFGDTPK